MKYTGSRLSYLHCLISPSDGIGSSDRSSHAVNTSSSIVGDLVVAASIMTSSSNDTLSSRIPLADSTNEWGWARAHVPPPHHDLFWVSFHCTGTWWYVGRVIRTTKTTA